MGCRKILPIVVVTLIFLSLLTNGFIIMGPLIKMAKAVDITSWIDSNTTINVTVEELEPIINWYDFQNSSSVSKLNTWIDVEEQYKFCINITSDQGWVDVDFINITAWYDNGSEANGYNSTPGGNLNLNLSYENTTGTGNTATWTMFWPDDEVIFYTGSCTDLVIDANTHNLTFVFKPRNQTRYAPGDGWTGGTGYNDLKSWNFNITVTDAGGNPGYADDKSNEYGYYMYTHITQVQESPSGQGAPGELDLQLAPNATVAIQCNANYTLYTNISNLSRAGGGDWIDNTSLYAEGGNLSKSSFDGSSPLYLWGTALTYRPHLQNNVSDTTTVTYYIDIPSVLAGNYSATVWYRIDGET